MSLIIFYLREYERWEKSPWYPSLAITNLSELPVAWSEEEINEFQDKTMIGYIKQYRAQYEEDFELIYKTFRDNKYDNFFPGISDPANYEKYKKDYYWAFNAGLTRFG